MRDPQRTYMSYLRVRSSSRLQLKSTHLAGIRIKLLHRLRHGRVPYQTSYARSFPRRGQFFTARKAYSNFFGNQTLIPQSTQLIDQNLPTIPNPPGPANDLEQPKIQVLRVRRVSGKHCSARQYSAKQRVLLRELAPARHVMSGQAFFLCISWRYAYAQRTPR